MTVLERAKVAAAQKRPRIVFPEIAVDDRVAEAADRLETEGLARPIGVGEATEAQLRVLIEGRGVKPPIAERMLRKPLFAAAAMVGAGEADIMIAGADSPTRRVIEAAGITIGLAPGVRTASSYFLMTFADGRDFVFADCAVNTYPDVDQLEDIARSSEHSARQLLGDARVALLSFSTGTSGSGKSVECVAEVAARTGYLGPIQADAALNCTIARKKGLGDGDANTLIFPNLDAGNIAYKLCQELAGARAIGPFLQGFAKPVCDLSRGATVDDIVAAAIIMAAFA